MSALRFAAPLPRAAILLLGSLLAALACLTFSPSASAYPQYVFKGSGDCNACHYSPTGGGLLRSWGRASLDPTFGGTTEGFPLHSDLSLPASAPVVDVGADVRLMPLLGHDSDATLGPLFIPMLTELGAAAAWGQFLAYGTVTARDDGTTLLVASREHWIGYWINDGFDLRVGRMVLPFGIRQPDHTQYVREDFGFDKWGQDYSLELDWRPTGWNVFASAFVGDLTGQPTPRQDRGVAATVLRSVGELSTVGVSLLGSTSTARRHYAASAQGRFGIGDSGYVLAELAAQRLDVPKENEGLTTLGAYARLGWFARPDLDVYLEGGQRAFVHDSAFAKERVGLGANWQVFGWFEFAPQVLLEARDSLPTRLLAMGQLHLIY